MEIKRSAELDSSITHYRTYLSDVIDEMVDVPIYIKKQLKSALNDMIDEYINTGLPPKTISLDKNKKLDDKVMIIITALRENIKLYIKKKLSDDIYSISSGATGIEYSNKDRVSSMTSFINEEIDGKTILDRVDIYTDNFKHEAEAFIVAGLANKISKSQIANEYDKNSNNPYKSELIKDAMNSNEFEARNIKSKGVSYGNGISASSLIALTLVGQDTEFRFYNKTLRDAWLLNGNIQGWISVRNSSYPCQLCDSQAYVFHPMSELFMAWHRRCVCLCVPITKNML